MSTSNPPSVISDSRFDPSFTSHVIAATGPNASPRARKVIGSLIQHMHDFARENEITIAEWMGAVDMMNWAGRMSDEKRNEGQLVCDVLGLESLIDEITFKLAAETSSPATASAILGPFFRHDAPELPNESSIVHGVDDGEITYMHGIVRDLKTQKPVEGATIDVWQASTNGLYEQQDEGQVEHNLRGKFRSDRDGRYAFYCLRPTSYPVPNDGPAGKLLEILDRHPYRPAHIHLIVQREGYKPVTTQIFDSEDQYLENDSVFAVKDSLVVEFKKIEGNEKAVRELEYPIHLRPVDGKV
ncbi:Aromatic compound dioxygenase [Glarea lozoyensis ATCC 20868]|uniref:Aromatic compound dioxygenase n=1 Tax=Glarea lozoyensis (strain ATCC 20868 / MF5171) TaxID=1116229 RepID=S3D1U7_GLAL2|nr:Aromatic compound dioxygenase [Glarea lozoyensis ATCC 20868]EPE31144.1 Aromatic compound dioxygenase [Glarea lozoyensis ATCC 20868]